MSLCDVAAEVMGLAQDGEVDSALALAEHNLPATTGASPSECAALWYTIAVARHIAGDNSGAYDACERCVEVAIEADDPGWASNGMSMRAMAAIRQGHMETAMVDLARAERELDVCDDLGLASWAHTGLGYAYLDLRLYELALPHMVSALELDASPIPLIQAPVIDLLNIGELHLRWADELERAFPGSDLVDEIDHHRVEGHAYAERAVQVALTTGGSSFVAASRAMELCSRPRGSAGASVESLRAAYDAPSQPDHQGSRAVVGTALARALWRSGRRQEGLRVAADAADLSMTACDWQVTASSEWLLVEMEAELGVPGADAGRSYAQLLAGVLWQQRLSTLDGAQAALHVEQLHHDNLLAQREANEDALTGVGNRRALDTALRALQPAATRAAIPSPVNGPPTSLLMIDLDDFKPINDRFGHVVGDEVLRSVAGALSGVARDEDVVARIGGDEFAVLARGADERQGRALAQRIGDAISALTVGTSAGVIHLRASVGVATSNTDDGVAMLLTEADLAMYATKAERYGLSRSPR